MDQKKAYLIAKGELHRCQRCDQWRELGLSNICPNCDKVLLDRMEELMKCEDA